MLTAGLVARALAAGADAAYQAVVNPVEGTILTVARAAAKAAVRAADGGDSLVTVLEQAHAAAEQAVAETPQQLAVLQQAGVVDAGGEGYRVILEGLLAFARGDALDHAPKSTTMRADLSTLHLDTDDAYGYCAEVLFRGDQVEPEVVRTRLLELGTSVLVVGDSHLLKVHVHTMRPGAVLDLATDLGEIVKVKVDNMQIQHEEFAASGAREAPAAARQAGTTLVAVALGEGFCTLFSSLGASVVTVTQTMNPSVQQLAAAIKGAAREDVIVAANDPKRRSRGPAGRRPRGGPKRLHPADPEHAARAGRSACPQPGGFGRE
jgi:dihydroxyacetone kinase-like predicted kinase